MRVRIATLAATIITSLVVGVSAARQTRASPHDVAATSVDGAELSITYGRPYMRGRTIFGALVPYGRVWCPGADEATTLATTKAITLGDLSLAAGRYTVWMLPTADAWTMIVSKRTGQWHTQYDPSQDLGRFELQKRALPSPVEQLTFAIDKDKSQKGGGTIAMKWETTEVSAPFSVVR